MPYQLLWYGPDTLMVQDLGTARITVLGVDGKLYRDVSTPSRMVGALLGRLPDGTFLATAVRLDVPGQGASGPQRLPMQLLRLSRDGVVLDTLGSFPGDEDVTIIGAYGASTSRRATFGRGAVFAMIDSLVYVGVTDAYRVQVFAGGRRLVRIIEKTHPAVPVTAAMVDSEKARRASAVSSPQSRRIDDRLWALDELPETLPAFRDFAVDADRWLWVRPYSVSQRGSLLWDVFDATGRLQCAVPLPANLTAREIGHDYLLGVARDDDGVDQARYYRVRRGGLAPS
jgi:hypothetical protein